MWGGVGKSTRKRRFSLCKGPGVGEEVSLGYTGAQRKMRLSTATWFRQLACDFLPRKRSSAGWST
jgi:hypothetical protein